MSVNISKLSNTDILTRFGPMAWLGRQIRDWFQPDRKQPRSESEKVLSDAEALDTLKLLFQRVKDIVEKNPKKTSFQVSLGEQWLSFKMSLLSLIQSRTEASKFALDIVITYEGSLWDSNYYVITLRSKKSGNTFNSVSIYGLN
jgi:hypothetical protein